MLHSTSNRNWGQPSRNRSQEGTGLSIKLDNRWKEKGRVTIGEKEVLNKRKGGYQSGDLEAFLGKNTLFEEKLGFEGMARREVKFF